MNKTYVIIVAAGTGTRFGSDLPKQFHALGSSGRPVLMHTVSAFTDAGIAIGNIRLVLSDAMRPLWSELCAAHGFVSPPVVSGGETRFHSVQNAVKSIRHGSDDRILVHDGARPLVSAALIGRIMNALNQNPAVIPVVSVTDSLRRRGTDGKTFAVDRADFVAVQTPQGFNAAVLANAYDTPFSTGFTDDASVVNADMVDVVTVEGDPVNIKITTPADLLAASAIVDA